MSRHVIQRIALVGLVMMSAACGGPDRSRGQQARPVKAKLTQRLFTVHASDPTGQEPRLLIDQGDPQTATEYYQQIERDLGIKTDGTLDELLVGYGYRGVSARDLELASVQDLNQRFGPDVIGVRFFAPKIIDVSKPDGDLGWRKVVRLRAKGGSPADAKNLAAMFLLFNVFEKRAEAGSDPFVRCRDDVTRCSQNNQVILVPKSVAADGPSAYWLVFESAAVGGGKRTDHLNATFDGGDQASTSSGSAVKPYHVPDACAQCHGGSQATAKLNILDSDHWSDRTQPSDDFQRSGPFSSMRVWTSVRHSSHRSSRR